MTTATADAEPRIPVHGTLVLDEKQVQAEINRASQGATVKAAFSQEPGDYYRSQEPKKTAGGVATSASQHGDQQKEGDKPVASTGGGSGGSIAWAAAACVLGVVAIIAIFNTWDNTWNPTTRTVTERERLDSGATVRKQRTRLPRLIHTAEFKAGQDYCDKYVPVAGTTFVRWEGVGASRRAICE